MLGNVEHAAVLAAAPAGGWSAGVRPQRAIGRALVTVDVPMGDLSGRELEAIADLAERYGDGALHLSRDQDVVLRDASVDAIDALRDALNALWASGVLGAPNSDRRHGHALGADRPAALGAGQPGHAVRMAVTGPFDGFSHVRTSVVRCLCTSLSRPTRRLLPPSGS